MSETSGKRSDDPLQDAVEAILADVRHEGHNRNTAGRIFTAEVENARLELAVDEAGTVLSASHITQSDSPRIRAVLERLCVEITGLPLVEAVDHGVVRILREMYAGTRPVGGILLPRNADAAFGTAERLIREIRNSYEKSVSPLPMDNRFVEPPTPEWLQMASEERLPRVSEELRRFEKDRGLAEGTILPAEIEEDLSNHPTRITVRLSQDLDVSTKPKLLRDAEAWLNDTLEPQIRLFAEELTDKSKLRRL